jgi:hypothetical protein
VYRLTIVVDVARLTAMRAEFTEKISTAAAAAGIATPRK